MVIDFLVVWRLTHLIQSEDGPWDLIYKFKRRLGAGFWFDLIKCFYCLSVWIGLATALVRLGLHLPAITYGIALSGAAILAQLISGDH